MLTGPGKRTASDEDIYENIVSSYTAAKEQQAQTRKWRDDEVVAFAQYLSVISPEDYADFLHQQREFNHIDAESAGRWSGSAAACAGLLRSGRRRPQPTHDPSPCRHPPNPNRFSACPGSRARTRR